MKKKAVKAKVSKPKVKKTLDECWANMDKTKRGRGRPKNPDPPPKVRQIGRIHDERWELWQNATKLSEKTFTDWAGAALDEAAKKVLRAHQLI